MPENSSINADSIVPWRNLFQDRYRDLWESIKKRDVDLSTVERFDLFDDSLSSGVACDKIILNARQFDIFLSGGDAEHFLANFAGVYTNLVREFDPDCFFESCLCCQSIADLLTEAVRSGNYEIVETTSTVAGTGEIKLANGWTIGIYIRYGFRGIDYIFFPDGTRLFNDGLNSDFSPTDLMPAEQSEKLFNLLTGQ